MITLSYGDLISPSPIQITIGTIIKPTLYAITDTTKEMSFNRFNLYETLIKLTPTTYAEMMKDVDEKVEINANATLFDIVLQDENLCKMYSDLFNFFFEENVIFMDDLFVLTKDDVGDVTKITPDNVRGVITKDSFYDVLDVLSQICHIGSNKPEIKPNFKNKIAEKIYQKTHKAEKKQKNDDNLTLDNIVSAVATRHNSLNYTNIWSLTVFQLIDTFNRLQSNAIYDINSLSISVWGDEKNTFDGSLWYKNEYKNEQPPEI